MLKLKAQLLERAKAAAILHGCGTFLPEPPEFALLKKNWKDVKNLLASIDLDTYDGYTPIRSFAPKSRLNVRRVALLHLFDFLIYTALVLALKDAIAKSRLPPDVVFSYRTEKTTSKQIYASAPTDSQNKVRRYSALALARSGSWAQAVAIKEYLNSGSSQCRTAMLLATAKLRLDERRFLKKSLHLTDAFPEDVQ